MNEVFITSAGSFLPNEKIDNSQIEEYLGLINGKKSSVKERILKQNGIETRYFAIDKKHI
jgi:3-oxoacyl-[acyl-carrier-protein] synthase-3